MNQLAHDVGDSDLLSIFLVPDRVLVEFKVLDYVLVVQRLHRLHLIAKQLEGTLVKLWVVQTENLDGELLALLVGAELDLGTEAAAKSASKCVLSHSRCHICRSLFLI